MKEKYSIISFYKFINIEDLEGLRMFLLENCNAQNIKGTILIAGEGINGTVAGSQSDIEQFCALFNSLKGFEDVTYRQSYSFLPPFKRMKVNIKPEIITFKVDDLRIEEVGEHLNSDEWDALLKDPESIVIDTRNDYEIEFGTFYKAINPNTKNFSDFPQWVEENLSSQDKEKPIAMFCTGGVRCEKSTAYLKQKGFKKVYHLKGGILQYLNDRQGKEHLWKGNCFVFDDRLAVDQDLKSVEEL